MFVCTGNICRSPIAERLALELAVERQIEGLRVSSAGTRAVVAHPIHQAAAAVLQGLGGNSTGFSARQLTAQIASEADLILTMTKTHRDAVLSLAPAKLHKTFTLAEAAHLAVEFDAQTIADLSPLRSKLYGRADLDIPDPIGKGMEEFEVVGLRIAELLPPVLKLCVGSAARMCAETDE